jgi:hypothetical protein
MTVTESRAQLIEVHKPVLLVNSVLFANVPQVVCHRFIFGLLLLIGNRFITTAEKQLNKRFKFLVGHDAIVLWIKELAVELNELVVACFAVTQKFV